MPQTCGGGGLADVCGEGAASTPPPTASTAQLRLTATGRFGKSVSTSPAELRVTIGTTGSAGFATGTVITPTVTSGRDATWSGGCSNGGAKGRSCSVALNAT